MRADTLLQLSLVAARKGDARRGAGLAQAGLESAEQIDRGQLTSALLYGCGFAALQLGQAGVVTESARRGQELSRKVGDRVWLRWHELLLGSLDLALGNPAAAAARLVPLAGHAPELGRDFEAELLPEAAEALIGAGDLLGAAEELARVSGRAAHDGGLTATELRIAGLIAQGMSNRAAAAELFVTVRAVESTLTKVYAKLGVRSRGQLASHLHAESLARTGAVAWPGGACGALRARGAAGDGPGYRWRNR